MLTLCVLEETDESLSNESVDSTVPSTEHADVHQPTCLPYFLPGVINLMPFLKVCVTAAQCQPYVPLFLSPKYSNVFIPCHFFSKYMDTSDFKHHKLLKACESVQIEITKEIWHLLWKKKLGFSLTLNCGSVLELVE